jgi:hypothetical protein
MNYTVAVPAAATASPIRRAQGRPTHLSVEGVDLDLPDGQPLMTNINFSLLRGESAGWSTGG